MAELGDASVEWHQRVIVTAARAGLAHLLVVGTGEGADVLTGVYTATTGPASDGHTAGTVSAAVRAVLLPGDILLVKGAHALGLETVADQLLTIWSTTGAANTRADGHLQPAPAPLAAAGGRCRCAGTAGRVFYLVHLWERVSGR